MKMMKKHLLIAITGLLLLVLFPVRAFASEFNFAVVPTIPDNQIDKSKTYYDLKLEPGKTQELSMKLRNDTDKDVTVETGINTAKTNLNGVVEYGNDKIKVDKTLKYNLKDLSDIQDEITIPAKSTKELKFKVSMPDVKFDGTIAGGITLKEKDSSRKRVNNQEKGLAIENKFSYVVAILLSQSDQSTVAPDMKLNNVKASQINGRNVILSHLQNPEAAYMKKLAVKAEVTKKGEKKVLYSENKIDMQMAPNTNFNFPMFMNGEPLVAGDYTMHIVAYAGKDEAGKYTYGKDEKGKPVKYLYKWTLEKDFSIAKDEAKKFNKTDVTIEHKDYTWLYILIGVILLLLAIILFLIYKQRKDKKIRNNGKKAI